MNSVNFIGRITADLVVKKANDKSVLNFTLAVDNNRGENKSTDFIPVTFWGNAAENISKYSGKGKLLAVKGVLHTGSYTKDNTKIPTFKVDGEGYQILEWNKPAAE